MRGAGGSIPRSDPRLRLGALRSGVLGHPGNLWRGHYEENYSDGLPRPRPKPRHRTIDPSAAAIGFTLAELDYVLGDELRAGLRERIREETLHNVVAPYEVRDDYWWLDPPTNNWNAVCNAGAVGTALYVEDDPERLARLVQKGVRSVEHYLAGFDEDGGTVEGVGFWNFGFDHYPPLSDLIESFTGPVPTATCSSSRSPTR